MTDGESSPGYPAHWEADVVLSDGSTAHLRPITPADADALQRFHIAQSSESTYLRFFAPLPRLSEADLRRFTTVDHVQRVALVSTIGEDIVAVGRYDQVSSGKAEVAFNVSDAHQGRGLGSVLLEHLAAAARENGIGQFVAEVLPQNRRMLSVFSDAGYEVSQAYDDGVISLHFDIDPTDRSLAVMEAREHRAEARSVQGLLHPRSVVVIGASRRPGTIGHALISDLLGGRFTGRLYVVHPEAEAVLGLPTHPAIADLPTPIDLAVVAVPAPAVLDVARQCAGHGVRALVVVSSGFAETGGEGLTRQRELLRLARANGMRLVGPNSWGMINTDPEVGLNVSLADHLPRHGRLGLFCQSGALSVSVLAEAEDRGMGLSTFVSAGNRADVSGNDCMQYWEEDSGTDVVGLYLESIGNPRKFARIARRLAAQKPVVVVKSGASGFGVPPGHAVRASRAPRQALDAMLKQAGCIRVENVHQLFDVAQLLLHQPLPDGRRVAVVANSDALGGLIADACSSWDLPVVHGPVALAPLASGQEFHDALTAAVADPQVDAVVAAFIPPIATEALDVARALASAADGAQVPVVSCFLGMRGITDQLSQWRTVPTYPTPEEAVRALATVSRYAAWRARDHGTRVDPTGRDRRAARAMVEELLAEDPGGLELDAEQSAKLLALYGVEVWPELAVRDGDSAVSAADRLGWPVALKTTAPHLRHRVDLGGVRLDIATAGELRDDVREMAARLAPVGGQDLVVQKMAPAGVACVVRSVEDPLFGPVVSFGLGGDASELLEDVAHRIPPLTEVDVQDLVTSVKAAPKLFGHRGAREVDVDALHEVIARVSCLADEVPEVADLELNPVVVAEDGARVLAARIRLAHPAGRTDAGRREMTASA